jgi:uncharacterized protein YciI
VTLFFIIIATDKPAHHALRVATKTLHMAHLDRGGEGVVVRQSGPLLDQEGSETGSLIIVEAVNEAAVRVFAQADPYAQAGLFSQVEIRQWAWKRGNPYLSITTSST